MFQRYCLLLSCLATLLATAPAGAQTYDVRAGTVNYDRRERAALKVQVESSASWLRDYFQTWMKDNYAIKFKGGGILGVGGSKTDPLKAKQTPASTVSGKLVDLYATTVAPSDSVAELAVFGGFDGNSFFDPDRTPTEFNALRTITQSFANAARLKIYRERIAEAEDLVKKADKDKDRLEKSTNSARSNTANNLSKIESLIKQNAANRLQISQDSSALLLNVQAREAASKRLQQRQARLSGLERK